MDTNNLFDSFDDFSDFDDTDELAVDETDIADDESDATETEVELSPDTTASFGNNTSGFGLNFDDIDIDEDSDDETTEVVEVEPTASEDEDTSSIFGETEETSTDTATQLFDSLNDDGDWLTGASLEDSSTEEALLGDTVDKNSFEGMFTSAATAIVKGTSSMLESGAITGDAFTLKYLSPADIIVWGPRIRKNTDVTALVTSIRNDGLLQPLVVAPTQTEGRYVLIKGARRLLACATIGMKSIPCIVNSQITISDIHVVEPLYSHSKPYSVSDMLAFIDYLKEEKNITAPSMIEYLLNLNSGDYMKLMDVMDDNDDEITSALLTGQIDIGGAFKKLEQKRKKMGKEKLSTARTEKIYGDAEAYGADILADSGETGNTSGMSDEEIKAVVEGLGDMEDMTSVDGEALRQEGDNIEGYQPHKQDPNNRERLDPKLRKAVLARDNNTCKICEQISGQEYSEVLDIHHIVEVYLGGNDDIHNLITACTCCHKLIHLWGRGELQIRPFDQMDEAEARKFKRIIKLGNIIREGMSQRGMKKEQLKKLDQADTIGRRLKGSSDQVAG